MSCNVKSEAGSQKRPRREPDREPSRPSSTNQNLETLQCIIQADHMPPRNRLTRYVAKHTRHHHVFHRLAQQGRYSRQVGMHKLVSMRWAGVGYDSVASVGLRHHNEQGLKY